MKAEIKTIDDIRDFVRDVTARGTDHAPEVRHTIVGLIGPAIDASEPGTPIIGTKNDKGEWLNVVHITIRGKVQKFSFDHDTDRIMLRDGWLKATAHHTFADADGLSTGDMIDQLASV